MDEKQLDHYLMWLMLALMLGIGVWLVMRLAGWAE